MMTKTSTMPDSISKQRYSSFVQEHQVEFMMVMIAGWQLPDSYILAAPSWEPDKFKKKGKE
jgi:hypothetical protein